MKELFEYDHNEFGTGVWEFEPERDLNEFAGWLLDGVHSIPAISPACVYWWAHLATDAWNYAANYYYSPYSTGPIWRTYRGSVYMGVGVIEDEGENKQREPKFMEKIGPFIEDFNKIYDANKKSYDKMFSEYRNINFRKLDDLELFTYLEEFHDMMERKIWKTHFLDMYPACTILNLFVNLCSDYDVKPESQLFLNLLRGFDNELLKGDAELEKLAVRATKFGLYDIFVNNRAEASEIMPKLEASKDGRKWIKMFNDWMGYYGWRKVPRTLELIHPTWEEDPSPAMVILKNNVIAGTDSSLETAKEAAVADRKLAEEEMLAKVPEAKREEFRLIMRSAQAAHVFNDEHDHYYEFPGLALTRNLLIEIGNRMVNYGCLNYPNDIMMMMPLEIQRYFLPRVDARPFVEKRKQVYKVYSEEEKPPFLGDAGPEESIGVMLKSRDGILANIVIGLAPTVKPELGADLYGVSASSGVAEGVARRVMTEQELREVRKGEILVAPTTSAAWTWAFALIAGVVVDHGGLGSHTSIVAREYGIPSVVNAFGASSKIKTGQIIRVDGNTGAVYIVG